MNTHKIIILIGSLFFSYFAIQAQTTIDHWETAVYADNIWYYRLGNVLPPTDWNTNDFDESNWLSGEGSIGYGDEDDNTVITSVTSLYMRQTFTITDLAKIDLLAFHADYDDGFVAYLNGIEIARMNMEGNPPAHTAWATALHEATIYQGGLPEIFVLPPSVLEDVLVSGENVLAIQTHNYEGLASSDLTSAYWLSLGINDESNDYGTTPEWFVSPELETHLPIVKINTGGVYIPDEPKIEGQMGIVWNGNGQMNNSYDVPTEFSGNIGIERRGQSSLFIFPKNGYSVELRDEEGNDMDAEFLGFPEEEDFILHGPYSDKSLLRNVLTMQIARNMGQYASRTRFVELIVNEQYEGIYVLMERIKRDKNRVDIAKLKEEDIEGDELTGGYVFKIDKGVPEEIDWYSEYDMVNNPGQKLTFQHVSPNSNQIQPEQTAYIKAYVDSFEVAMANPNETFGGKRYDEYIDITSFAEHFIVSELTKNVDAYRISTYMHKDKDSDGGLMKAGPVWDFNLAYGNNLGCNAELAWGWMYAENCGFGNPFWWEGMMQDEAFRNTLKCRWLELRQGTLHLDSLFYLIDEKTAVLDGALERNFERWPVLGNYVWNNAVVLNTHDEEVQYVKDFLSNRIAWMDENIPGTCITSTATNQLPEEAVLDFSIRTNRSPNTFVLSIQNAPFNIEQPWALTIQNSLGHICYRQTIPSSNHQTTLDLSHLPKGIYFASLQTQMPSNKLPNRTKQFVIVD